MSTYDQITNYAKATLDELDAQMQQAQGDLEAARRDVEQWKTVSAEQADALARQTAAITALTATIERLTAERDALQKRLDELEQEPDPEPDPEPTPGLWFKLPDDIRQKDRKVFGHYFGPYPRSLDNATTRDQSYYARNYLNPAGEGSKFAAIGGFLRNAPIFRPPVTGDYVFEDCKFDIRAASAAGHDGFLCDVMGESGGDSWDRYQKLVAAAVALKSEVPGFLIVPMLDTNGNLAKSYAAGTRTADQVAAKLATFAGKSCTWYLDGKFVISSFKAEGLSLTQWQGILDALARLGHPAVFYSVALDYSKSASLAPSTIGEGSWGYGADPALIRRAANQTAESHSRGKRFMFPVTSQNLRPNGGWFDESLNTEGQRASWEKAIAEGTDHVQHVTWSDLSEGAECAPSEARGFCVLDIDAWYLTRWKTGRFPAILRDAVILSHRSSPVRSVPTGPQTKTMKQWIGSGRPTSGQSPLRDAVEALLFLTAPARVRITTGAGQIEQDAPADQSVMLVPLAVGAPPKVEVLRGGKVVAQVASVVPVKDRTAVDDRGYYLFSSVRGTAGQRASVTL